jgi:tetratricopeptide (TPR) repeat protein
LKENVKMIDLKLESASYSELDFPLYNGPGFAAVQQAVAVAQQARALAQNPDELQKATWLMRSAADRKNHEQAIAMRNFDMAREKAYNALRTAATRLSQSRIAGPQRLDLENTMDHLITKFGLKNFPEVERESTRVTAALTLNVPKPIPPRPAPASAPVFRTNPPNTRREPQSASAWFEMARMLERQGRTDEAIHAYRQALRLNPRHFQAENQLNRLTFRARRAG